MEIIRRELSTLDLYPANIRYDPETDTVQVSPDGGATWVDSPNADPRNQTQFPPRVTDDTRCDAAASMIAHLQGILNAVLVGFTGGALAVASSILALFFPEFALLFSFIALVVEGLIGIGIDDLTSYGTGGTWDTLLCILLARLDGAGQLNAGSFDSVGAAVDAEITGVDNTITHLLLNMSGWGGLNYAASTGAATGDCAACADVWCKLWEFADASAPFEAIWGSYAGGVGWEAADVYTGSNYRRTVLIEFDFGATYNVKHIEFDYLWAFGSGAGPWTRLAIFSGEALLKNYTGNPPASGTYAWDGNINTGSIRLQVTSSSNSTATFAGTAKITSAKASGDGANPDGDNNC